MMESFLTLVAAVATAQNCCGGGPGGCRKALPQGLNCGCACWWGCPGDLLRPAYRYPVSVTASLPARVFPDTSVPARAAQSCNTYPQSNETVRRVRGGSVNTNDGVRRSRTTTALHPNLWPWLVAKEGGPVTPRTCSCPTVWACPT